MWGMMIPSFPSVTSAGPHPPQATFFFRRRHLCFEHHGFGGFSPLQCGYLPQKFGHRRYLIFFQKRRGLKQRHSKPLRGKPEEMIFLMNVQETTQTSFLCFFGIQPFIDKRRSWHQSISCLDILSLSLAEWKVIECTFETATSPGKFG